MRRSSLVALSWVLLGASSASCRRPSTAAPSRAEDAAAPPPVASAAERSTDAALAPGASAATAGLPDVPTDWCLDGLRGLDEATCYLLPDERPAATRLLIYLSGIVPPTAKSPQKENVQRVVAAAARRAGVAVLLPRGRRGIGPSDAKDWWAWPTSAADVTSYAPSMLESFRAARAVLERALGRPFARTYLAGSSSGAYFVAALALSYPLDVDGFAAASGGAPGLAAYRSAIPKRPFYVGYAAGDPTNGGPKALAAFLSANGWPVRVAEHPGGHGAREVYLDEALAFWDRFAADAGAWRQ